METPKALADRLREVLTEGEWVTGTNYKNQIINTDWKDASTSVDGLNSIAQLSFHINYYVEGLIWVLKGGTLDISDKYSFGSPPIQSAEEWNQLRKKFCADAEEFIALVEKINEDKLRETFFDEKYGNYHRNINVMIEHCYYHLGQILILRKLIDKRKTT